MCRLTRHDFATFKSFGHGLEVLRGSTVSITFKDTDVKKATGAAAAAVSCSLDKA